MISSKGADVYCDFEEPFSRLRREKHKFTHRDVFPEGVHGEAASIQVACRKLQKIFRNNEF